MTETTITRNEAIRTIYNTVFLLDADEEKFIRYTNKKRTAIEETISLEKFAKLMREAIERKEELVKDYEKFEEVDDKIENENLEEMDYDDLEHLFIKKIDKENYFVAQWEWNTMAQQLCTAICKIKYRRFNDWDKYTSKCCRDEVWTYASRIHNHCFKLKRDSNYKENLRYMLIRWLQVIDSFANKPAVWSVYDEVWTFSK